MSADKQSMIEKYEDEIRGLQETRHREQVKLTADHCNAVAELKQQHEQDMLQQKHCTEESIHSITQVSGPDIKLQLQNQLNLMVFNLIECIDPVF